MLCSHLRFQIPVSSFHRCQTRGRTLWKLETVFCGSLAHSTGRSRVLTQSIRAQHTSKQRRKPGACRRGKRLKLRQLKLTERGFRIEPRVLSWEQHCRSARLRMLAATVKVATDGTRCASLRVQSYSRARSELKVPPNETSAVAELASRDAPIDEDLIAQSSTWEALGPRSGISDAQRLLRWFRLSGE